MNTKLEITILISVGIFILIGLFWSLRTEKRLKKFFSGKKGKDLEDTIVFLEQKILNLEKAKFDIENELDIVNNKLKKSIRGLETVRFNPFPDQGGNQSFAMGMLNEDGDGVVISTLYGRDRMSIFAKPIKQRTSEYGLSEEEKEVLRRAEIK